jgi:hypothetical protein
VLKTMLLNQWNKTRTAVLLLAALGLGAGLTMGPAQSRSEAAPEKPAAGLDLAEFQHLRPLLDIKNQPWTHIPWKYSITEARRLAAATHKPIFMVVNTGNALGCT